MVNELQTAFNAIAEERALPADVVLEALQSALVSAYRRDSGASNAQRVEAHIDPQTGRARIYVEKEVAEQDEFFSTDTEVTLEKARYYDPEAEIGDTVMVQVENTTKSFGRIAAQTAKQVILQKIREAERESLYQEFIEREGDIVTGTVQNMTPNKVTLSLGRAEGILLRNQQIPRERYHQHEKLRVYILEVKKASRGPEIICSRSHRNMLRRLLEYEVPEIYNGQIEIKSIAREAGYRSKVAVAALQEGIDPVGACVGMRGIRIQNIVKELHDEKIDVIEWNNNAEIFISKALSPARVTGVYLDEEQTATGRTAVVVVPDEQLSLAIGREGQNARLAAKLTGWRIDIKSVTETVQEALENIDAPHLMELFDTHAPLIDEAQRIMNKKAMGKAIMPEEYTTLGKLADAVERRLLTSRQEARAYEQEQIDAVRATLPQELFQLPLEYLALAEETLEAIRPMGSVGEVLLATLTDERSLKKLVDADGMAAIQTALDILMEADIDFNELLAEAEQSNETASTAAMQADTTTYTDADSHELDPDDMNLDDLDPVAYAAQLEAEMQAQTKAETLAETKAETLAETKAPSAPDDVQSPADSISDAAAEQTDRTGIPTQADENVATDTDVILDAFGGVIKPQEPAQPAATPEPEIPAIDDTPEAETDDDEALDELTLGDTDEVEYDEFGQPQPKKKKKERKKRRQLVFDEETGEVVAKRKRKSNRKRSAWDELEDIEDYDL